MAALKFLYKVNYVQAPKFCILPSPRHLIVFGRVQPFLTLTKKGGANTR